MRIFIHSWRTNDKWTKTIKDRISNDFTKKISWFRTQRKTETEDKIKEKFLQRLYQNKGYWGSGIRWTNTPVY